MLVQLRIISFLTTQAEKKYRDISEMSGYFRTFAS